MIFEIQTKYLSFKNVN